MEIKNTNSNIDHNSRNNTNKYQRIKPFHFFIIFVAISTIIAFIFGGYFIGKEKTQDEKNSKTEISEQIKIDVTELPNNPEKWTEYELEGLGMYIKLPETMTELGDWNESGDSIICFSNETSKDLCQNENLIISSASKDFIVDDFQGVKGFEENSNSISIITSDNKSVELKNETFKKFDNTDYEILKILGSDSSSTPYENHLGAIVITGNKDYPALIFQMDIEADLQEFEFDQILGSLKSTK